MIRSSPCISGLILSKISDTTYSTALLPPDSPDRSKVTPDGGGLGYVFNQWIGTVTAILYLWVQRRNPKNSIPLPVVAKRSSNRNMSPLFLLYQASLFLDQNQLSPFLKTTNPIQLGKYLWH
ncbi:hypothetical protein O181_034477 [Austropuccinia psidii MF-1]|uniref:Uncharacterized protein n=1 Tax=Austropuccinia psidii MF-1 TaxID=1389203 RepID=A0A9Q3D6N5_9BASI|nr:hypothetical protein [Austropuccinia psidii MF-1]